MLGMTTNDGQSSPLDGAFASVSAWARTTPAGLRADGSVECWGDNEYGQSSPLDGAFASVSAGVRPHLRSACGRKRGMLGIQRMTASPRRRPGRSHPSAWGTLPHLRSACGRKRRMLGKQRLRPVLAAGRGVRIRQRVGLYHTCGLRADGSVECWGWNADTTSPRLRPGAFLVR